MAMAISGYSHTQFCNKFQVVIQANNIFFCNQSVMGGLILCSTLIELASGDRQVSRHWQPIIIKFYSSWIDGLDKVSVDKLDMVQPDVVIIINSLLLVIEGKFFGDPQSQQDAKEQIQAQRRIIECIILQFPGYEFDRYCHIYLSAESHLTPTEIECHAVLTWEAIKQLSEQVIGANHYVTQRFAKAIDLHQLVFNKSKDTTRKIGQNYRGKLSLSDIVVKCQIEGNDILVGYFGGASALRKAFPKTLTNRRFKWDSAKDPIRPKKPQNWIIGGNFLKIVNDGVSDSVGKDSKQ